LALEIRRLGIFVLLAVMFCAMIVGLFVMFRDPESRGREEPREP